MKPLYRQPVLLFGIIFTALIAVQSYYLWNTAKLWKSEIYRDVHNRLDEMGVDSDEKPKNIDDSFAELITKFDDGKISKYVFLEKAKILQKQANTNLSNKIDSSFQTDGYTVGVEKELMSIFSEQRNKTLISKPLILLKSKNYFAEKKLLSTGRWGTAFKHRDTNNPADNKDYKFIIYTKINYGVQNINTILFKKLAPQILLNILLCGFILYIFSKTLKNLQRQQGKIAELHTTIDSISHELNTPVTTLRFSVASMQASDFKSVLQRQISRIENISGQISRRHGNHSLLDLQLAEDYFKNIRSVFPVINFQIVNDFKFNKTISTEDFELFLDNLVGNSVKYGASKIEINTIFADEILLKIHDDGIGIPENETENIFKKYYRVPRPENLNINGLGLGLFLVKETVNKYSGEITVQQHAGNGCLFLIKIPQI